MKPFELAKANLDQRLDRLLEARLPRDRKRLLVALPYLDGIDSLLETIVTGDQELLDPRVRFSGLHDRSLAAHISV